MLTIDLLRGQGIPARTRPASASLLAIVIAMPVVLSIVTLGNYVRGGIEVRNQKRQLTTIQTEIFKLTDSVKYKQDTEKQIEVMGECFVELHETLPQQIQWSPILQTLAENIPASLVLSSLDVKTEIVTRIVSDRRNPTRQIAIQAPKRILHIGLYGRRMRGSDEAVLQLLSVLNESSALKGKTDNIRLVAQATDKRKNAMNYVIECIFKPY